VELPESAVSITDTNAAQPDLDRLGSNCGLLPLATGSKSGVVGTSLIDVWFASL